MTLLNNYLNQMSTTVLGLYNVMSGGAFAQATVFALSIQPYINSQIIIQLLTIAIPALERLQKDGGEEGKKKIQSITRYATVGIAILQGFGYYMLMKKYNLLSVTDPNIWNALVIIVSFVAGSSFVMWMGEQVTEFGIGNGISIILFAGILSRVPLMVSSAVTYGQKAAINWVWDLLLLVAILLLIVFIVFINEAERRIPVQYAKRQVGRKMYGGQSTNLPMKVNMSRAEARQMVRHGHFTVNGKKVNIPSFLVKPGDVIELKDGSRSLDKFKGSLEANASRVIPKWLEKDKNNVAKVIAGPTREDIDLPVEEHLIVELYSK